MSKKAKSYVNLVGSSTSPGRKRKKIVAKKSRKRSAATRKKSRGKARSGR